jgi:hypothetical protein
MGPFQSITVTIAAVILILCLVLIGVTLYNNKYNTEFPPVVANCPDWWLDRSQGDGSNCKNVKKLGSCNQDTMDFSSSFWTGTDGMCRKFRWARECNLTWDGVTNASDPCPDN